MNAQTPKQVTPDSPANGVITALDEIWHREGPLTAADLRTLTTISLATCDLYDALDQLARLSAEEVEDLESNGGQDPSKATRVIHARQVMARFNDLSRERIDPESIDVARLDDVDDREPTMPEMSP